MQYNIHTISCCVHWNVNLHEHPQSVYYKSFIKCANVNVIESIKKNLLRFIIKRDEQAGSDITGSECSSNKHSQIPCEFFNQIYRLIRFSGCPFDRT